jgi:ribonuclease J
MSAMSRVAVDNHKSLTIEPDDTVALSARIIPGNEKAIYRMMNHLARRGADVVYGAMNPPVHVSGHGSAEELRLVLNLVRPRFFVPIHGEYRQLAKHAQLAQHLSHAGLEGTFVLESGETLEVDNIGARKGEAIQVGRVCIDSGTLDEVVEDMVIRDRRHMAEDGFVLPIIAINKHSGRPEGLPEIVSRGFMSLEESSEVLQEARNVVIRTIENSTAEERGDRGVIQEKIRVDLKRYLTKQTSRRPLIMPVILEV